MSSDWWKKVEDAYHAARELSGEERSRLLDAACSSDAAMRRQVDMLLQQDENPDSFLNTRSVRSATPLAAGIQLGSYCIEAPVGEGGMGVVYRARDAKLNRPVAIKFLSNDLADATARRRFQREAQMASSLNHPHILTVHDVGEFEDRQYLVTEFVDGGTLDDWVRAEKRSWRQVVELLIGVADGLAAAHGAGILHRDIKPANILVASNGYAKLADFGLAKLAESAEEDPTRVTQWRTGARLVIGTIAYMSPEQASGKRIDARSDIFSFGVVLYEMLAGRKPFENATGLELMEAIIHSEPEPLPATVPLALRMVVEKALEKDRSDRYQSTRDLVVDLRRPVRQTKSGRDISDAGIAIGEVQSRAEADGDAAQTPRRGRSTVWLGIAAVLLLTTILALGALSVLYSNRTAAPEIRVEMNTPSSADPFSFAISPDGRRLVFSASNEGKSQLWIRPLDSIAARPLAGADGATYPFWSPDSASVGFFADAELKSIDIVGGAPQVLANATSGRGGAWNRDGTILFAPSPGGTLLKVPATAGEPVAVTRLETGQTSHRFPQFLPDGRHFIYFVQGGPAQGVYVGSLDGASSKRLANADAAAMVSPSGFLLFQRQTTLLAQTFDFKRQELSGNPFPVADHVAFDADTYAAGFSATSGIVAYRSGSVGVARRLTWLDRYGKIVGAIGAPDSAGLTDVELSTDGKRVAVNRTVNGNADVWLIDAARGVPTRFTFDAAGDDFPVWSPDGSRVVFQSSRKGRYNLYWKLSSGAGADELLLESDQAKTPTDWSPDGRLLLFRSLDPQTSWDLWVLPVSGNKKPFPFLKTPFEERNGQFSPDGKWIAYQSNESGRFEIYVQPFPGPGGKFQISSNGGAQPRWNKNSKEIFYVSLDSKMMAAIVKLSPDGQSVETETPAALFPVHIAGGPVPGIYKQQYAVSSDGQRFLVNLAVDEGAASPITLILNWKPKQ